ncbi:MAG TPA: 4Fe-4S dicluster domain-containing protein [Candidatus Hydrogenedentes bacterium]|nr:4Fe-4S dicluster domain-containing protein [Candidatus Hydrogenedentota bacterium]
MQENKTPEAMVSVFIMGKKFRVPAASTVIGALEYAGYQLKRGVGCREGFCGACATVYRLPGDYKLRTGLACQTVVSEGMLIAQMPFVPTVKPAYDLGAIEPAVTTFKRLYPEVFRCLSCNTCTKACPQDINVMDYINAVERNDITGAAEISFDCIRCGLCALRCPAEIGQFNVAILAQRLHARYLAPRHPDLKNRVEQIRRGDFNKDMEAIKSKGRDELRKIYYARDIEEG